jgi:hypothetical protein
MEREDKRRRTREMKARKRARNGDATTSERAKKVRQSGSESAREKQKARDGE